MPVVVRELQQCLHQRFISVDTDAAPQSGTVHSGRPLVEMQQKWL